MMRSLWTAASGMIGQQFNIDTVSNNLSNVNTTGFKQSRAEFEDLIYQTTRIGGTPATEQTVVPMGIQVGHGVRVGATQKLFHQGNLQHTDVESDMAIEGEGFFRVVAMDGTYAYTRDGSFNIDSHGQLVTSDGYKLLPELVLPSDYIQGSLNVNDDGKVYVNIPGREDPVLVGQVRLFRFVNPAGLRSVGDNLFKETIASGEAIGGTPTYEGMGAIKHKFLEMSNVSVAREMVNMIVAQRAYELNSKAIQTSDTMLGIANNLKR
jgi:flagellar basal-body rod protein FlgG